MTVWNNKKVVGYSVLFFAIWFLILYLMDLFLPFLSKVPHRISGEIWFQLISSIILTIPTIIISAYALIQTEKYRKLDEERYKPDLLMQRAELSMCMINWHDFFSQTNTSNILGIDEKEECEQYKKHLQQVYSMQEGNYQNVGLLKLKADFILKSGDSVDWIELSEIEFEIQQRICRLKFDSNDFKVEKGERDNRKCKFEWDYEDGYENYHLEWLLDFSSIQLNDDKWMEFWDDMYEAIVADEQDICKRLISGNARMKLGFGSESNRAEGICINWKMKWDGIKRSSVDRFTGKVESNSGIFKYIK